MIARVCGALAGLAIAEAAAWLLLVPGTVGPMTFLAVNLLGSLMLCVGFGAAANGQPDRSVAQLLCELERTSVR